MSVSIVLAEEIFNDGAQLWVIPDAAHSHLASKIDWYLNFQIGRSTLHQKKSLAPELLQIAKENEVELWESETSTTAPLMVASERLLPNLHTISLQYDENSQWIQKIQKLWNGLGRPKLRVFLPTALSTEAFRKIWKANDPVELCPDTPPRAPKP